jgi:hypothetical protein
VLTSYTGTVHFTNSDAQAVLPANYTFIAGDGGTHTFTNGVILKSAGSQSVTATDTAIPSITGSVGVSVSPAAASKLGFGQQPPNTRFNSVITPAVTVSLLDAYGNLETADNAHVVTIAIGNNPAGGTLSGTTSVTVSGGVATFSNLSINKTGNGYTLVANSVGLTSATSVSFNITKGKGNPHGPNAHAPIASDLAAALVESGMGGSGGYRGFELNLPAADSRGSQGTPDAETQASFSVKRAESDALGPPGNALTSSRLDRVFAALGTDGYSVLEPFDAIWSLN